MLIMDPQQIDCVSLFSHWLLIFLPLYFIYDIQLSKSSRAKHGGAYFSAVSG